MNTPTAERPENRPSILIRVGETIMDPKTVETHVNNLTKNLKGLSEHKDFNELLTIIHRPGWATLAESMFVTAMLESMNAHTQHLTDLKNSLLAGARAVSAK